MDCPKAEKIICHEYENILYYTSRDRLVGRTRKKTGTRGAMYIYIYIYSITHIMMYARIHNLIVRMPKKEEKNVQVSYSTVENYRPEICREKKSASYV